jgi:N-acetylglucosaminyl-diphospho-decaprenol L-rhamnosyltransferase
MLDLDIGVIYTYERELIAPLIESLCASGDGLRMRLILVDNDSPDGAEQWARAFAESKILHNTRRATYAVNLNRILAASSARYVLLLNTDMYFTPSQQCLARMVAFLDSHPRCGVVGCRLQHADGSNDYGARRFQTLPLILARRCGLGRLLRRSLDRYFYAENRADDTWQCDWLRGCFLMVRRDAYEQIGGFDEGYRKYFEDVDFCLRMARGGWLVMYHGAVSCCHFEQRASKDLFSADAWTHLRSYFRFLRKWGFRPNQGADEWHAAATRHTLGGVGQAPTDGADMQTRGRAA